MRVRAAAAPMPTHATLLLSTRPRVRAQDGVPDNMDGGAMGAADYDGDGVPDRLDNDAVRAGAGVDGWGRGGE